MNIEAVTAEHETSPILSVPDGQRTAPLRVCVEAALQGYFQQMAGHLIRDLYQLMLTEVEEPLIRSVMEYTKGNQTQAADILGISRSTLRKKLTHYKLG